MGLLATQDDVWLLSRLVWLIFDVFIAATILDAQSLREEKGAQTRNLVRISSGWDGGLPHAGVGAKKLGMSFETEGDKTFWRDMPGFFQDIPGVPEKFEKNVCVQFSSPKIFSDFKSNPLAIWNRSTFESLRFQLSSYFHSQQI